ncbi:MAG TPA: hypothetical protein VHC69_08350 [Polyangiaceae bacterium]|nr:hypothetical protein [Polyangiaceae bacterium]
MALTERDLESIDPLRLDREIARAAAAVRRWRRRLRSGGGLDDDPFVGARVVASRRAFGAVRELPDYDPLRAPLTAWIYRLTEQRVNAAALVGIAVAERHTEHVVNEPERAKLSLASMLERALSEPPRRAAWLTSFARSAAPLGEAVSILWERRQEIASRMGLAGPDLIESPGDSIVSQASKWLDRTADLLEGPSRMTLADLVDGALGERAREGWPRALSPWTILDWFRGSDLFRDVDIDPGELPRPFAPASYLRALGRVGAAWVDATAPSSQPFVIANDPYGLRRRTFGALFAALPWSAPFARRALGLSGARIAEHRRALGVTVLIASRAAALRVLLRAPALAGRRALREAFEENAARAFRVALSPALAGAVFRLHADDPQRFAGTLLAGGAHRQLVERHEEDWYRNPRAIEQLRDEARLSPERTAAEAALAAGADALFDEIYSALR